VKPNPKGGLPPFPPSGGYKGGANREREQGAKDARRMREAPTERTVNALRNPRTQDPPEPNSNNQR
jgi:hypothetical protein